MAGSPQITHPTWSGPIATPRTAPMLALNICVSFSLFRSHMVQVRSSLAASKWLSSIITCGVRW